MATEKWVAGATAGWATAGFSTEVNSVVTGNAIRAASAVDNSSALDMFDDLSISLGSITPTGIPYIGVYMMPLNQDGTTYGDGKFNASAAGPPVSQYFVGAIPLVVAAQVQTGILRGIILPPGQWKYVLHNVSGITLAGSANTIQRRSYNRVVA